MDITKTATTTLEQHKLLAVLRNLAHNLGICLTRLLIGKYLLGYRAEGYGDDDILGIGTRRACTMTILTIFGKLVTLVLKVYECPVLTVTLEDDATALAAITTIGATEGYELLATEMARASTAMS